QRRAVSFNEIEPPRLRIDDNGAPRIFAWIAHFGAAEAGAVQAEDIVDALLGRAARQHLAVGLGLRETERTKQSCDHSHSRNITHRHVVYPYGWKWYALRQLRLRGLACAGNCHGGVIISHYRWFFDRIATHILAF